MAGRARGLRFRHPMSATHGRVAVVGDYLYAPTVEGAVLSGVRTAERVLGRS